MKAAHWLLSGFGCVVASIVLGAAIGIYWLGQMRSFQQGFDGFDSPNPLAAFGVVLVAGAASNLLFFGGLVLLVIGFIKMSQDSRAGGDTGVRPSGPRADAGPGDPADGGRL